MEIKVNIVNAFIDGESGGNPAGVVLQADHLSDSQRIAIASKVGLSETAFVSESNVADFKLDFYTPTRQIAHCGHATIAVFSYLKQAGLIQQGEFSKETIDGNRKILINGDKAYMEQLAPRYDAIEQHHASVLESLGLNAEDVIYPPKLVNTGNSFVVLGVKNEAVLAELTPNLEMIKSVSEDLDLIGYYIFTTDTLKADRDAATRMIAPRYGIDEEAATGMAAGPLACYLKDHLEMDKNTFYIEQGNFMTPASPSVIEVNMEFSEGKIQSLMAGGIGKVTQEKIIEL
ncbi:MAG: PhzF family phenazine biosynthesis protein [Cocleimonas sp.]|jgi:PhzF family phenazine biosynthesis protein